MSNQNSNPMSQYSGLNAPLIFPEKPPVAPTAADILGKKPPVLPPVVTAPPVVVAPVIETPVVDKQKVQELQTTTSSNVDVKVEAADDDSGGFFGRMKLGLTKTRRGFTDSVVNLLIGGKEIDDELLEEIETQLLVADIGVEATRTIVKNLTERTERRELIYSNALYQALQEELVTLLAPRVKALHIDPNKRPYVILMVGVNGVGKTTTIGKLAKRLQGEGKKVMLAAGDTFRAAATEQLQVWGERNDIAVVSQGNGADSASVIFDAFESARAKGIDVLIADTAGRLHTKSNLMEELKKVKRVMQKIDATAPHEIMLVVDAGTLGKTLLTKCKSLIMRLD